jgi:hypothetical protein
MMNTELAQAVAEVVNAATQRGIRRATRYLSSRLTVKATRRHKFDGRASRREVVVTIGAPNYAENIFIKRCKQAGEPFPVKRVLLQLEPKK